MGNKAAKEFLEAQKIDDCDLQVGNVVLLSYPPQVPVKKLSQLLTDFASQQKPETIKSDNSKINISLLEEVERLRKIETSCIKLMAYGQKQIELNREAVDLIKSDELKPEQTKVFQFRLAQGKFYGWRDSMKFLNEALNK